MKYKYTKEDYICEEIIYRIKRLSLNEGVDGKTIFTGYKMIKNGIDALHSGLSKVPEKYLQHLQRVCRKIESDVSGLFSKVFDQKELNNFTVSTIKPREWGKTKPDSLSNIFGDLMQELKTNFTKDIIWQDVAVIASLNQLQETFTKALNIIAAAIGKGVGFAGELIVKGVFAALVTFGVDYFGKGLRNFIIISKDCIAAAFQNAGEMFLGPIRNFFESETFKDTAYDAKWRESGRGKTVTYRENGREYQVDPSYVKRKDNERRDRQNAAKTIIDRYISLYKTEDWKQTLAKAGVTDKLAEKFNSIGIGKRTPKPYDRDINGNYLYSTQASILLTAYDRQKQKDMNASMGANQQTQSQYNSNGLPRYTHPAETTRTVQPMRKTPIWGR